MALLILALCAAVLFLSLGIGPAQGQEGGERRWTTPLLLGDGWWQSITMDQQGTVYVGWYGTSNSADLLMLTSQHLSGSWIPANDVLVGDLTGGWTVRNALTTTSDGVLHAAFRIGAKIVTSNAVADAADNATSWSTAFEIAPYGYYLNMASDSNDVLHLVYSGRESTKTADGSLRSANGESSPCALCLDLYYVRSADSGHTWTNPHPISAEPNSGADRPEIFQGFTGRMYIIWDEGYDWYIGRGVPEDVRIVYSADSGLTWSLPIVLVGETNTTARPIQGALTELRDGSLLVVWRYSDDADRKIYYQLSSDLGKTWTDPDPIDGLVARSINDTPLDDYALVTDRLGISHLFAVGQPDERSIRNAALYHVEFRQGIWLSPQRVFYSPDARPEWPKAVIGLSNDIHLSWFNRGIREGTTSIANEDYTRILKVYYSHLPGNLAPLATREFRPTNTPPPTPTVFQQIEPSPTPLPTLLPLEQTLGRNTADTYAAETLLAGTGVVALFCGAIILFLRYLRR